MGDFYMVQFRYLSFFFLSLFLDNIAVSSDIQDQKLAILISYGLGDNPHNAVTSYKYLYPSCVVACDRNQNDQMLDQVSCVIWTKDSLKSSISDKKSYIDDVHKVVEARLKQQPFIGVGHSRGAEMLLRYVGRHNPAHLKCLILVATPLSVGQAAKQKVFGWFGCDPNISAMQDVIKSIKDKSLPIVLLHQGSDSLVTVQHSRLLYEELKKQGFSNTKLIIMDSGNHNDLIDQKGYRALQQWLKQQSLPYDASCV